MMVAVDTRKGYDKLAHMQGVYVNQKMDWLEVMSGCEMPNRYYIAPLAIHGDGNTGKGGEFLFKAKEESSCCQR